MKKYFLSFLLILLITGLWADDAGSAFYADASDLFGIDPHAGMNSFLSLLIPSGGKYEGMGTAFTAMSDDSSFLDSNPAGSTFITDSEMAFYHNNWIADTNIETVSYTNKIKKWGFGIAGKFLYLPFTGIDDWGDRAENEDGSYSTGYYTETIATLNSAYTLWDNYYFSGIAVGGNLKIAYRGIPESIALNQSAWALMTDLGIQTKFNLLKFYSSREKNLGIGLVVKNMGTEFIADPDPLPTMVSTGIFYSPLRPLTWTFDVNVPFNLDGSKAEAINYATGLDVNLSSFLSVQSGFLIKKGLPRFSLGSVFKTSSFSIAANYTLDLTTQVNTLDRFSLTLTLNLGDWGRRKKFEESQALYLQGLEEYAQGNISKAIDLWEECLSVTSGFTPAQEMIETAKKTRELNQFVQDSIDVD